MFLRDTSEILNRMAIAEMGGKRYTYGELESLSLEYITKIPTRSLVLILCDNNIETIAFYYCQMTNHVVPILVDKHLSIELLSKIIKSYEPQFIWCSKKDSDKLQEFSLRKVFQRGEYVVLQTFFSNVEMHSDLALLLTTSGSTGSLKMVRLSYDNLRDESKGFGEALDIREDDRGITSIPMCFSYGLCILHIHWKAGACMYATEDSVLNVNFWNVVRDEKITNIAGVSYTYDILKRIGFLDQNYDSIRFMLQGGGKFSEERQEEFGKKLKEKGIKLYIGYGQTETMAGIAALSYKKILKKKGSIGAAISGVDFSVYNPDEQGIGELVCKGKCISMGYSSGRSDLMQGDENAGYLHTGDMGFIDDEGDIYIKGRKSRFVKILGIRVSLDELEMTLALHLGVEKVVCTGIDDDIVVYHLEDCEETAILDFCSKEIQIPKNMISCRLLKEFPYTSSGKIKYADFS